MKNRKYLRVLLELLLAAAALGILWLYLQKHAPRILGMIESGSVSQIDDYLTQYGPEGKYLLILLQAVETISIVLPAVPVYLCAGVLYGKPAGTAVCWLTNLVLNAGIFVAARKLHIGHGHPLAPAKQPHITELFKNCRHPERVVLLMCLMPVVPNGMIPYLSAQTDVDLKGFCGGLAVGSLPAILAYVCCGDLLVSESWKSILPLLPVLFVLTLTAFCLRRKLTAAAGKVLKAFLG